MDIFSRKYYETWKDYAITTDLDLEEWNMTDLQNSFSAFEMTVLTIYARSSNQDQIIINATTLICSPLRASYTINNTWENNIYRMTASLNSVENLASLGPDGRVDSNDYPGSKSIPGFWSISYPDNNLYASTTPRNWTADQMS